MSFSLVFKFLIFAAFIRISFFPHVSCKNFHHFNFSDFPYERINELRRFDSGINKYAIQVTYDLSGDRMNNLSGRSFYRDPFTLWRINGKKNTTATFSTTFKLNIANQSNPGGEGLAFIITGKPDLPRNSEGQWLGIVNSSTNGSSEAQIVAVEFDTRKSFSEDIDDNHIGLNVNSIFSMDQVPLSVKLSSGENITVRVEYDGKNMIAFVGYGLMELNQVLSQNIDLSQYLPEKVFVGFSASTSNFVQSNCVLSWEFHGTDIDKKRNLNWVWMAVVVAVVLLLLTGVGFCLYRRRKHELEELKDAEGIESHINDFTMAPKKFKLRELKKATGRFSPKNKLGKGGFGTVYKGTWKNREIAVKRVSETSRHGKQEFIAEVTTIGSLRHRSLVKLIGWCYEKHELLLVYEYMPNGSLDKFIFVDEKTGLDESTLNWETRVSIIHGTAQALEYLHNGCEKRVLHRDIKASNILLDSDFKARLGDFGLARTIQDQKTHHSTNEIAGTPGYMAPEIFLTGRATVETDVYAFGVLIMEVVCGRKPGNQCEQNNYNSSIVHWLWELHRKGRILDAADSKLEGNFSEEEMEYILILGLACCHPNPHQRPSMKLVLQVLSGEATAPEVPTERPSFVWPAMPPSFSEWDQSLAGSQLTPFSEITGR
ncbi:probable L-type lectin-domain containing receptor kinase S.5 [Mangifera indica]|uniref:probable L-type lectin-domain containing receptor kinase S.5 n=1 Tax=Mangifera indica TaxID=29780 RepID=UPI001CFA68E4|nr:probable L-type lectin-domain containing receptor kinase S.5 [Mangifera indica]